jgi:hypothetical protein
MEKKVHEILSEVVSGGDAAMLQKVYAAMQSDISKLFPSNDGDWCDVVPAYIGNDFVKAYMYMLRCHDKYSGKVYEVDGKLAHALAHSDVTVNPEEVRFPVQNMIIYIKDTPLQHYGKNVNDKWIAGWENLEYVMVQTYRKEDSLVLHFVLGTHDSKDSMTDLKSWNNTPIYRVELGFGNTVSLTKNMAHSIARRNEFTEEQLGLISNEHNEVINLIFGLVLYMRERTTDVVEMKPVNHLTAATNPKKLRRMEKSNSKESQNIIYLVGRAYKGIVQQGSGNSLTKRVLVSGHWRSQWYGSRKDGNPGSYKRIIWIEPFYKGLENEVESKPLYRVSGSFEVQK